MKGVVSQSKIAKNTKYQNLISKHTLTKNLGIFQIETKSEDACYLGRLKSIDRQKVIIDDLDTKGNWDGEMTFVTSEIRIIEFDTDYVNSLKLVSEI